MSEAISHRPFKRLGRPKRDAAAHETIMDAVQALLQATAVPDLTMEAMAKRAGVGKPTLSRPDDGGNDRADHRE
jgi:transcriptional regulator GlxA family with amidase domain